jgi:hypothetical protein
MVKNYFILILFCLFMSSNAQGIKRLAVYVVAHPDDWQLFMSNDAYTDIQDENTKVVFILTTSGDASRYTKLKPDMNYTQGRERGVLNAIRFCGDIKTTLDSSCHTKHQIINSKSILHYPYKNLKTYLLRLPDGCFSTGLNGESLEYLYKQNISSISAIDSSATYNNWEEVVGIIRNIVKNESSNTEEIILHTPDIDESYNPNDHPDHRYTGLAALQACDSFPNVKRIVYVGYDVGRRPINLEAEDIAIKAGIFAISDFGLTENNQGTTFDKAHLSFLTRCYKRELPIGLNEQHVVAFPNPATDVLNIDFVLSQEEQISVLLTDITGKNIWKSINHPGIKGINEVKIPLTSIPKGIYIISVQRSTGIETIKVEKV